MKHAVKYLKMRYNDDIDILIPKGLVYGTLTSDGEYFSTDKETFCYVTNPILDGKYVIGDAYTIEELRKMYNESEWSEDQIINFFYDDMQDKLSIVKDGFRKRVGLFDMFDDIDQEKTLYQYLDGESALFFNKKIFDIIEGVEDFDTLKQMLKEYADRLVDFDEKHFKEGIDSILVKDGHVVAVDRISPNVAPAVATKNESKTNYAVDSDISVEGLYKYLSERILGHNEELKRIATILVMNHLSTKEYGTESIIIPGPTGTGKTATFECASEYFNVPFKNINTCNLVPEGIVGTTVEDEFSAIIDACHGDIDLASHAILCFDEFDKMGKDGLDIKRSLENVFLKVIEGSDFPINRQLQALRVYNTRLASKVFLGTFEDAFKKKSKQGIGFNSTTDTSKEEFDRALLYSNGYFSKELLSRIQHYVPYENLDEETLKSIILKSKLSAYILKKHRLKDQFGIEIIGDEEFAEGVMEELKKDDKSVRDLNNIIASAFLNPEYEILSNKGKYKTLVLGRDTIKSGKYDLS